MYRPPLGSRKPKAFTRREAERRDRRLGYRRQGMKSALGWSCKIVGLRDGEDERSVERSEGAARKEESAVRRAGRRLEGEDVDAGDGTVV